MTTKPVTEKTIMLPDGEECARCSASDVPAWPEPGNYYRHDRLETGNICFVCAHLFLIMPTQEPATSYQLETLNRNLAQATNLILTAIREGAKK